MAGVRGRAKALPGQAGRAEGEGERRKAGRRALYGEPLDKRGLREEQRQWLEALAAVQGRPVSALIRDAADIYITIFGTEKDEFPIEVSGIVVAQVRRLVPVQK